jgi:hypothetical protein
MNYIRYNDLLIERFALHQIDVARTTHDRVDVMRVADAAAST